MLLLAGMLAGMVRAPLTIAQAEDAPTQPAQEAEPLSETYPFYQDAAIAQALPYLQSQQQDNGGIDPFGSGVDAGSTARTLYALNAVGYPTNAIQTGDGTTMLDFLETQVISYTYANNIPTSDNLFPGRAGLMLAAVAASGADPTSFAGVNLVDAINGTLQPTGAYSTTAESGFSSGAASGINQAFAIFGLVAAGQPIPTEATDWLVGVQEADGSWFDGDIDATSYGITALIGSGNVAPTDESIQQAIAFLRSQQTASSALWNDGDATGEAANSTAWAITALATAGYLPMGESWAQSGTTPQQALVGLQNDEGIIAGTFENAYSTLEALNGLTAQPLYMTPPARTERALGWIAEQQNTDGGWSSFGTESDAGATVDVLLAFLSAGYDPASVTTGGNSPLDFLASAAADYTRDDEGRIFPSQTGKLIVGIVAAGGDPTSYGADTLDLVSDLQSTIQPTGAYSSTASRGFSTGAASPATQSFAIFGLAAAGASVPLSATDYLVSLQDADGSWGSPDNTGLALQALRAADFTPDRLPVRQGTAALRDSQIDSGGWGSSGTFSTNSTAYAIQGLLAAGVDLTGDDWLTNGRSPLGVLGSYQKPDGPFALNWNYAGISDAFNPTTDNLFATQQAVPVLRGAFFPYTAIDTTDLEAFDPIARGPDPDRIVIDETIRAAFSDGDTNIDLLVPFGSDLNGDSEVELAWRVEGGNFTVLNTTRASGFYTATLDLEGTGLTADDTFEFRAIFSDADGVQRGSSTSPDAIVNRTFTIQRLYLPLIANGMAAVQDTADNYAGLVVRFSDGSVETDCVSFSENTISGADALQRSDFAVEVVESPGLGTAVCKIGSEGCPADTCFCDAENSWKYFLWNDGSWQYASIGASSRTLSSGDIDGWAWGSSSNEQAAPPALSFAEVCPEA
jgi:hypothetical protein